jgi:hypothetical protein
MKDGHDGFRVIIGSNAINRQCFARHTFMDQHQLTARVALIFVPALLHGQSDGLHRRLARGQTVSGRKQIEMA